MKGLRLYLIICAVLLTVYIVAQFNRPKQIDWTETLNSKEKTPYGAYILYSQLNDLFPHAKIAPYRHPIYSVIAEDSVKKASYVIICPDMEISKPDYDELIKYIKQGNNVFIAAGYFGQVAEKELGIKTSVYYNFSDDGVPVNFVNPKLDPKKYYTVDKRIGNIYFSRFDTARTTILGENVQHQPNFVKFTFGKGALYLISNPKFFSNYSLLKSDGAAYAATALSFVKNTPEIIWDEYYTQGDEDNDSPMRVFLSNPALQWAYYIAIFGLLAFVLFEIKRRQRIIPVIEPLTNSTLDFVNVIGQLYYEKRNNADIAHKKVLYFLAWLRDEYQIKTNKLDEEFTEKLTAKLDIDASFATDLVNYIRYINAQVQVTDRELIQLNKLTEQLYTQSA